VTLYRTGAAAAKLDAALQITGDLYQVSWTDYSATSTIVGWSSFTEKFIYYKKRTRQIINQTNKN
jgi:hypothetical protein